MIVKIEVLEGPDNSNKMQRMSFAPGSVKSESLLDDELPKQQKVAFLKSEVVFSLHQALTDKSGLEDSSNILTRPFKTLFHSVNIGEIDIQMSIKEKKETTNQTVKLKFDS